MDIEDIIRTRLKELRETHYPDLKEFTVKARIFDSNVRPIEAKNSRSLPSVRNLVRWVRACGLSLAAFFTEVEMIERDGKAETEHDLVLYSRALSERDPVAADHLAEMLKRVGPRPSKKKSH